MRQTLGKWRRTMTNEEMAQRVEAAILNANEGREKEEEGKEFEPRGHSPKHTSLIKRIDLATKGDTLENRVKESLKALKKEAGKPLIYQTVTDTGEIATERL